MSDRIQSDPVECQPDDNWPVGRRAAFYTCFIVLGLGAFDFIDRQIMAAVLPYIKAEWALTDTKLGMLISIVNIMLAVLVIPSAYFIDRWSRKKMIAIMGGVWSLATGACAFAGGYGHMLLARLFIGAGEAGYNPAAQALLTAQFPKKYQGTAIAITQIGMTLGIPLGLVIGAFIAQHWGWRHAFGVVAVPGMILAVLALFIRDYHSSPAQPSGGQSGSKESYLTTMLHLLRTPSLICAFIGAPLMMMYNGAVMNWLPSYLIREGGLDAGKSSNIAAIIMLSQVVGAGCVGPVIDSLRHRYKNAAPLVLTGAFALALVFLLTAYNLITPGSSTQICLLFIGCSFAAVTGTGFSAIIIGLVDPRKRATAISLMIVAQNIFGFALGPLFTGILSDHFDLATAMNAMCSVIFLAMLVCLVCSFTYIRDDAKTVCRDVNFN